MDATTGGKAMKKAYLWIVVWEHRAGCNQYVTADLFFSSREAFCKLWLSSSAESEQLVEVDVPDDFNDWDYIPENY